MNKPMSKEKENRIKLLLRLDEHTPWEIAKIVKESYHAVSMLHNILILEISKEQNNIAFGYKQEPYHTEDEMLSSPFYPTRPHMYKSTLPKGWGLGE
ncbi:MAG: hypothetical protein ACI9JN_001283 [Bacteroidia bacterium]|jgi:hypothetical protein